MAALLEFDSKQQRGKVEKAEEAIVRRIQELAFAKGGESELRLLHDGLSIIRQLKERLAQPSTINWWARRKRSRFPDCRAISRITFKPDILFGYSNVVGI